MLAAAKYIGAGLTCSGFKFKTPKLKSNSLNFVKNYSANLPVLTEPSLVEKTDFSLGQTVINYLIDSAKSAKSEDKIEANILITKQAELAGETLAILIDSLLEENKESELKLYNFIAKNYKLPLAVLSQNINSNIIPKFTVNMPFKVKNDYNFINEAGVYMFTHTSGKFALGSAINFERRLLDHLNSFRGHRIMQQLHQFAQINGGLQSFT